MIDDLVALAADIAHEVGALQLERQATVELAATKSSPTDAVTEVDRASEALILARLRAARPDDAVLAEEGSSVPGTSGFRWVVDPLDGTVNYLYRHPTGWGVSLGIEDGKGAAGGVVFEPGTGEVYSATRGGGAFLNGRPIAVSNIRDLSNALVGTGFSYQAGERAVQGEVVRRLLPQIRDIRRAGSAALDLCWVACGRLDAYYELLRAPWDFAAGALIVTEAGGIFRDYGGVKVAGPPALFEPLRRLVG